MKIAVVCASGIGDLLIMHIVSHHLRNAGHSVTTITKHHFGSFLPYHFAQNADEQQYDAFFLQHDNSPSSFAIRNFNKPVFAFFGAYVPEKHGVLTKNDYICDRNKTMVENAKLALAHCFGIQANTDNGFLIPPQLSHRKYAKRVVIHTGSSSPLKNWPFEKFEIVANWLTKNNYEPVFLPQFSTLEQLASFIYESGVFIGNDSGPSHLASYFQIPHLVMAKDRKNMALWRPGWGQGIVLTPPSCLSRYWQSVIRPKKVIKLLKNSILNN